MAAAGCAGPTEPAPSTDGEPPVTAHADADAAAFPLTIENCGVEVTFDAPPERVVLLESAPITILQAIGVLDSVVLRAGSFPVEYYDDETNAVIESVPSLGEDIDASGHLQISEEVVIDAEPDLVFGLPDGITRAGLAGSGIQVLEQPVYCAEAGGQTTFEDIYEQVETYGTIFGRTDEAAVAVADLRDRVNQVVADAGGIGAGRTAAVLYPTIGGGTGYAYGNLSMAHPQLVAAGFTNVFADVDERVFEVTLEDLIDRDPDVLVLLYIGSTPDQVKDAVVALPGSEALTAVQDDEILVQLFNFTEPPTPLSVDGLQRIAERFGDR